MNHTVLKTNGKEATRALLLVQCFDLTEESRAPLLRALLPTQCDLPWVTGQSYVGMAEACLLQKHDVISHKQLGAQEHVCFQNQTLPLFKKKKLLVLINKFSKVAGYKVNTEILCCISTH